MRLAWLCTTALIGVVLWSVPAAAQGTDGYLPEPITVLRLGEYGDLLELSTEQRQAADDMHAAYREQFRTFNEREIAPWWTSRRNDSMSPRSFYTRERDLAQRIGNLDNRLFDQLQLILSDEQAALLPRIRQARERERLAHDFFVHWGDLKPFDLSEALMDIAVSPEQRQAIDPIILAYEPAMTAKLKAYIDASFADIMRQYDALERAGFDDKRILDPANRAAVSKAANEVFKPIWMEEAPRRYQRAREIYDFNRTTLASLEAVLGPQEIRWLRNALLRRSYASARRALHDTTPFDEAMLQSDLDAEQRAMLEAESSRLDRQAMARIEELIEKIDALYAFRMTYTDENTLEYNEQVRLVGVEARQLAAEVAELHAAARQRVAEITGIAPQPAREFNDDSAELIGFDVREATLGTARQVPVILPAAISQREIAEYARRLRLDDDGERLLREAHARYADRCKGFDERERKATADAAAAFGRGFSDATTEKAQAFDDARTAAARALESLDEAFFADVQATLNLKPDDANLQRVRLARQRQWWNPGLFGGLRFNLRAPGGASESLIDFSVLVPRVFGSHAAQSDVDAILKDYEDRVSPLMQKRYALILATQDAENRVYAEFAPIQAERPLTADDVASANERHDTPKTLRAAISVNQEIASLNRQTLERIAAIVSPDEAQRLRETCERLSWPRIMRDPAEAGPLLARALALHDLTPPKRSAIEDLAANYRPAYLDLRRGMIESVEKADSPMYAWRRADADEHEQALKRSAARKRMLFDRYELNMRIWQRLRTTLTPEQARHAGIKPIPPEPPDDDEDF